MKRSGIQPGIGLTFFYALAELTEFVSWPGVFSFDGGDFDQGFLMTIASSNHFSL
jgi:hypothetical protein